MPVGSIGCKAIT